MIVFTTAIAKSALGTTRRRTNGHIAQGKDLSRLDEGDSNLGLSRALSVGW